MNSILEVSHARVRFSTAGFLQRILKGIEDPFIDAVMDASFDLRKGETLGLVGESGCGKTTLGGSVIGLTKAHSGSIRYDGKELVGLSESGFRQVRRDIAMMFQDPIASLSPRKTVRFLVSEPFRIHRVPDCDYEQEARRLMNLVGLQEQFLDAYPHQLSGGQARRVGVARALALNPKIVIADEPTAGLDVSVQGEILNLMRDLQQELGLSFLIITHNLPVVRHISHRLAIMYLGRFVEIGDTASIFGRPAHPYTLGLLAAVPVPDPEQRRTELELIGEVPSLFNRPKGCEFHSRCPFAQERCKHEPPEQTEVGPGHLVSCHDPFPTLPGAG